MTGKVDDHGRALLTVALTATGAGVAVPVDTWVDTGFTGQLTLPLTLIQSLGLPLVGKATTLLADGKTAEVDRYQCSVDWFGEMVSVHVLASRGVFPLLGVALLAGHVLIVDYEKCTVELH